MTWPHKGACTPERVIVGVPSGYIALDGTLGMCKDAKQHTPTCLTWNPSKAILMISPSSPPQRCPPCSIYCLSCRPLSHSLSIAQWIVHGSFGLQKRQVALLPFLFFLFWALLSQSWPIHTCSPWSWVILYQIGFPLCRSVGLASWWQVVRLFSCNSPLSGFISEA